MLSLVDRPRVIEVVGDPRKDEAALKLVYMFGTATAIDNISAKRRQDNSCRQLPKGIDSSKLPSVYHVRVFYWVDVNGISVNQIDVKFGQRWSCFFEADARVGTRMDCNGHFHRHFLQTSECVENRIYKYEKHYVISRLAKLEPSVLTDLIGLEEADEPDPFFEAEEED